MKIYALDYVNLAAVGPIGPKEPEGGPDAAGGGRHVDYVRDEEAMSVGFVASHAYRCAARGWRTIRVRILNMQWEIAYRENLSREH